MKYIVKFLFVALLIFITLTSCKESTKEDKVSINTPAKLQTTSLSIEGMTCEIGCAKTIEAKIGKIAGVTESKVDFENKKGMFTYDANVISEANIASAINGLLDGKTYKAQVNKTCTSESEKKCDGKEGKACEKSCPNDKKNCSEATGKTCETKDKKGCCVKSSGDQSECEKACTQKKEGDKVCDAKDQKACCSTNK